jgi:outer membrane protein TolC
LENLIGEELPDDVTTAEFSYMVMPPADEKKAMELARNNHPALLAMRESLRMHRFAARAAKGDLLPTIGLQWNLNSGTQLNESQSNWDATLYVGFNIFDAGEARAKVKEAKIGHQKAVHDLEGLERDISLAVQQALLQIEEAKARLEVAKEAEAQAKESMRLTEESFKAGSATSQSLLDDETALVAAEQRRITAEFDRILAETHLWFSIGGLERALFSTAQLSVCASEASIATMTQEIFATGENK